MSNLRLSLGCWNYDRTRGLAEGRIQPDGIDLTYLNMPVEETFFRMLRHQEFDVAELSLSSYAVSLSKPDKPFIAIPVFPSRFFRHSCIYVNAAAGIREPKDLVGKRVGNPEYQMTAPVWIRGILQDEYGVPVDSVTYHTGGEEEPGRSEPGQEGGERARVHGDDAPARRHDRRRFDRSVPDDDRRVARAAAHRTAVEAEEHRVLALVGRRLREHLGHQLDALAADAGEDDLALHQCALPPRRPTGRTCGAVSASSVARPARR